jgi:hypothetical protein
MRFPHGDALDTLSSWMSMMLAVTATSHSEKQGEKLKLILEKHTREKKKKKVGTQKLEYERKEM